jgi:hypothetical protein
MRIGDDAAGFQMQRERLARFAAHPSGKFGERFAQRGFREKGSQGFHRDSLVDLGITLIIKTPLLHRNIKTADVVDLHRLAAPAKPSFSSDETKRVSRPEH